MKAVNFSQIATRTLVILSRRRELIDFYGTSAPASQRRTAVTSRAATRTDVFNAANVATNNVQIRTIACEQAYSSHGIHKWVISAVADGPERRATSRAARCTQEEVIYSYWLSTVASTVNLV